MQKLIVFTFILFSCYTSFAQDTLKYLSRNIRAVIKDTSINDKHYCLTRNYWETGRVSWYMIRNDSDKLCFDYLYFYENGDTMACIPYVNGKHTGVVKEYFENGQLKAATGFENDLFMDVIACYDEKGNPRNGGTLKNGTGTVIRYEDDGTFKCPHYYEKGKSTTPPAGFSIYNEDSLMQDYIKKHELNAIKTDSGLYYQIWRKKDGKPIQSGMKISFNYTGYFIDGTVFDSNTRHTFKHEFPVEATLGKGELIPGLEEVVMLFHIGDAGKILIPSRLAYGFEGNSVVPPYAVLVFDFNILSAE